MSKPVSTPVPPHASPDPSAQNALPPVLIQRRRWAYAALAGAAALAGVGVAWRNDSAGTSGGASTQAGADAPVEANLWQLKFDTPSGQSLSMASLRGKTLLLNFWATWCPPCVEELPLIDRFYLENAGKGWQVLGLAVDQLTAVNSFLGKSPVTFPVALAGLGGVELSKTLGNLSGGLPFTVVLGASGAVLHRKMGRVLPADLLAWAGLK